MDLTDKDYKVTMYLRKLKIRFRSFGRKPETIKKKQMKILELKMQ